MSEPVEIVFTHEFISGDCEEAENEIKSLRTQLTAAQATIAQRDAQVAALQAELAQRYEMHQKAESSRAYQFRRAADALEQLAARDAQVAELTAALEELTDTWHDTIHGVEESVEIMRACPKDVCKRNRALLERTPAAPEGEAVRADG